MATMNAGLMAEMYEAACSEAKDGEMTREMYEGACNSMKEAYAKKLDEMMEAYSSGSSMNEGLDSQIKQHINTYTVADDPYDVAEEIGQHYGWSQKQIEKAERIIRRKYIK